MRSRRALTVLLSLAAAVAAVPSTASAGGSESSPVVSELASFAAPGCTSGCGSGSTIGPDGALYVTDGPAGRVLRVDPDTGAMTTFAQRSAARDPRCGHRRSHGRRLRRRDRVRARHARRTLVRAAGRGRRHLPDREGTAHRQRSRTSERGRSPIRPRRTSSSTAGFNTPWRCSAAISSSPTGISTASCASPVAATSAS